MHQELLQLAAKEFAALGCARMGLGEIESKRGQGIDHAEVAHLLPVDGFHADDADDDLGRHAEFLLGALQRGLVVLPEPHAGADADRVDEAAAVHTPVLGRARRAPAASAATTPGRSWAWPTAARTQSRSRPRLCGDFVGQLHGLFIAGVGHAVAGRCVRSSLTFLAFWRDCAAMKQRRPRTRTADERGVGDITGARQVV